MKTLGIDYGDARTGISISAGFLAASPSVIFEYCQDRLILSIMKIITDNKIEKIVIGLPKNMNASEGERAAKTRVFAENIKNASGITPILWDERSTTVSANNILNFTGTHGKKRKKIVDAVAATIILQSYLDSCEL